MRFLEKEFLGKELKEYKHVLILLYYLVIGVLYLYVNKTVLPKDIVYLARFEPIDDLIPFVKYMVIPYYLWYPYLILPLVYFALKEKDSFLRLAYFLFGGMTIVYIFYIIVPNGIGIGFRPVITETDFFSRLIQNIYNADNPTNSCPSIHVLTTIGIHLSIVKSKILQNKKGLMHASRILAILICASTVMIKQHSIVDVVASIVLSVILRYIIYRKE